MAFKVATLVSTVMLFYFLAPLVFTSDLPQSYSISLVVYNSLSVTQKNLTFTTDIAYRGILLGAMRRIQAATNKFRFKTKEDPNYGPFLVSVNGLAGKTSDRTYWQLLVKPSSGDLTVTDVGVGCYIPYPQDTVILKFTKW